MSSVGDAFRKLWERFGSTMTRSTVYVDGTARPMTEKEREHFDAAFLSFDDSFSHMNKLFEEARRENTRRKV